MTAAVASTALAFLAEHWDADVTVATDPWLPRRVQCGRCSEPDRPVAIRIYIDPRSGSDSSGMRECCIPCAPACIADAHADHDDRFRRPIRVEV